ncbi:MAG: YraN family protein [Candidatus Aureabacteria bacterium]|nr:YraN family protein [Candidatus Auribacterota bacterium]
MKSANRGTGIYGEDLAADYLKKRRYKLIERNWRFHRDEIDIIALQKKIIVFIEVKLRKSLSFGTPEAAVTFHKKKRIIRAAKAFLAGNRIYGKSITRFDVIAITPEGEVMHITDAFGVDGYSGLPGYIPSA